MDNENQPQEKTCVCGSPMRYQGHQLLYLREPGFFHFESYADYAEVELYICPQCRRGDFFFPTDVISEKVEYSEVNSRAFYREQYQNESTENLRKVLGNPYLPWNLKETVREILDERSGEEPSRDAEKPPRAEPWTKSEEKKGFFSSLFGGDDKPKKNQPPEF